MEQQRNILFILFLTLTLFIYWAWERDQVVSEQQAQLQAQRIEQMASAESQGLTGDLITLQSDNLQLTISSVGGDIVDAKLLKVLQEQGKDDPFHLLMSEPLFVYQAQSGLIGANGPDSVARPTYTASSNNFTLQDGQDEVSAVLSFEQNGVTYTKTYTLKRDSYVVDVKYDVVNSTDQALSMAFYGQLKQTVDASMQSNSGLFMVAGAYRGSAYSTAETRYEKHTFEDLVDLANEKSSLNVPTTGGWVSMIQHYFVSAWIGDTTEGVNNVIYSGSSNKGTEAIIGIRTEPTTIAAHGEHEFKASMWIGPKSQDVMETVAPNLDLTVDYGWLWFISIPLFKILEFIHGFIGNWGFSIILLTLVVRGVLFPLTKAQYTSMAKMRLLTPKMQELRERYGDDRQKLGQETMKLYKNEKVNPLGGCFPLLIQMPIFIALYWTLMESTELRHSPFILWITDLSVHDPYFVTPILYGISMFFIQKMSPTPVTDPMQRKIIMAMPVVFTFMFCTFPAGLTLYWLVSNCFTIFQQIIIFKSLEKKGLHVKAPKAEK
ncbi:MAG TPA: membrane protein insertase YidC [Candidatus Anaerobiospirillum pullistercoris]|uniref:Membrane protein insertase YidC n=1 Tax=Candidatus Anaerobiospirillum pullistercoris TaxID=2838452 RepID=A0A9D1WE61_9GAMM|nr:membrane protein insertase YidC [Candidatus Anaerobiospirillum pullistercoris]